MMNIKLCKKDMKVYVSKNNKIVKQQDMSKEQYAGLMKDLVPIDMLDTIRKYDKKFKAKAYVFRDVK